MAWAIIVAAGEGARMAADVRKPFLMLEGRPVLGHTLKVFDACDSIEHIVLVVKDDDRSRCEQHVITPLDLSKPISLVAGGSEEQVAALMDYGYDIGVAFQIRDDVLDVVGNKDGLGKPVANDLGQGKMSLATLFALRTGETAEDVLFSSDAARARQVLADTGAIDYAVSKAREYSSRGKEALSILPDSAAKAALCELADFVVARDR